MFKNIAFSIAGVSLVVAQLSPAYAQVVPGNTGGNASARSDPGYVMLSDFVKDGSMVRGARPENLDGETPIISREEFLRRYPDAGPEGYKRIADSNYVLCEETFEIMGIIFNLDQMFASADEEFAAITQLYNALPKDVKNATAVMTIAQAGSAGALCLLSAGLYCIAAVVVAIGNIFVSAVNKKLQLSHIVLSIANIRLTRLNIASNRVTLRLNGMWLRFAAPACAKLRPEMWGAFENSFLTAVPNVGYGNATYDRRVKTRTGN